MSQHALTGFLQTVLGKSNGLHSYPELGSIYKAAVVKTMLFWCNDFIKESVGRVIDAETRSRCIHGFAKFQFLLDIHGPFFQSHETNEAVKYARAGLIFYQQLVSMDRARTDEKRFYKIIPKCHSFYELTVYIEATNRNPRYPVLLIFLGCFWYPSKVPIRTHKK